MREGRERHAEEVASRQLFLPTPLFCLLLDSTQTILLSFRCHTGFCEVNNTDDFKCDLDPTTTVVLRVNDFTFLTRLRSNL